jgi:putative tryptophan/tyrosine transport system substrate-binding protein
MKRREVLAGLAAGAGASSFFTAAAQQSTDPSRRIGVLMDLSAEDPEGRIRLNAFRTELARLGWTEGENAKIDVRWGAGIPSKMRQHGEELIAAAPDVILAAGSLAVAALQQSTTTVPVVFVTVADPVGAGYVQGLARPGGNITGFMLLEYSVGAKWLQLLKDVDPRVRRVAVLRDPAVASGSGQFGAIQAAASSFGMEVSPIGMRDNEEMARALDAFARAGNGGLIVTASPLATLNRELIVAIAMRGRLPAVYSNSSFALGGGLLSYSPDRVDQLRQAASYVDRILKGEKPGELPVQAPTKYELIINLKSAKVLGLIIPPTLLARADEVIE